MCHSPNQRDGLGLEIGPDFADDEQQAETDTRLQRPPGPPFSSYSKRLEYYRALEDEMDEEEAAFDADADREDFELAQLAEASGLTPDAERRRQRARVARPYVPSWRQKRGRQQTARDGH